MDNTGQTRKASPVRVFSSGLWKNITADGRTTSPAESVFRFHYLMAGLIILIQIGGAVDARSHVFFGSETESFFTPSHYLFYAGWLAALVSIVTYVTLQIRKGADVADWLPPRYMLAGLGAVLFGMSGVFDAIWHTLFGFELNLEILLSPAHLVLFFAAGLLYFSVQSHAIYQYDRSPETHQSSFLASLPLLIGLASFIHIIYWPTYYFDPLTADFASGGAIVGVRDAYDYIEYGSAAAEIAGIGGIVMTALILAPIVIVPLYRWRLPAGSLVFILGWISIQRAFVVGVYTYLPAVAGAALVGEIIWAWMRRGGDARMSSPVGYRLLAFTVPLTLFSLYFLIVSLMPDGIIWGVTLWAGSIWLAALASVLMSTTIVPGRMVPSSR